MTKHLVTIVHTGEVFPCKEDEHILQAAIRHLRRRDIPVGCCNGGCGVCKINVLSGEYVKKKMSRSVVSETEEAQGCVLACKVFPRGDMKIEVVGKMVVAIARKCAAASVQAAVPVEAVEV